MRVVAGRLEAILYGLAARAGELVQLRAAAAHDIHLACTAATLACSKQARMHTHFQAACVPLCANTTSVPNPPGLRRCHDCQVKLM